jgi:flavin-dependent dehydrogenase
MKYDCMIVGGGLSGLALSILMARAQKKVLLIEKKKYPAHKVCGEYISNESRSFLNKLGIVPEQMHLPEINQLVFSDQRGRLIREQLDSGGFGIRRFVLDESLFQIAQKEGVDIRTSTTCLGYEKNIQGFKLLTSAGEFEGQILCGAFGRYAFGNFNKGQTGGENWVGVKYHLRGTFAADTIGLHLFEGGYCGMSKVDDEQYCLCYLVKAEMLKRYKGQISLLETEVLQKNPRLAEIWKAGHKVYEDPLTISNVTFYAKQAVADDVFYLGDSAGSIAPLTGNGMSNALRSAAILEPLLQKILNEKWSVAQAAKVYEQEWNQQMGQRIRVGRWIQYFFCQATLTPLFFFFVRNFAFVRRMIIRMTHGKPF